MIKIIYEDRELLVCFKPAGIPTQTSSLSTKDVVSLAKSYLAENSGVKNSYLGLIHRLDQPVSGLLVLAKNKRAASLEITAKQYQAICLGTPVEKEGQLKHYLWKNPKSNRSEVVDKMEIRKKQEAKEALLSYKVQEVRKEQHCLSREGEEVVTTSLVKINLKTGRFHQIRAQFSAINHPLLGDLKYGNSSSKELSQIKGIRTVALCATGLKIIHPVTKKEMEFRLPEELSPDWIKTNNNL